MVLSTDMYKSFRDAVRVGLSKGNTLSVQHLTTSEETVRRQTEVLTYYWHIQN